MPENSPIQAQWLVPSAKLDWKIKRWGILVFRWLQTKHDASELCRRSCLHTSSCCYRVLERIRWHRSIGVPLCGCCQRQSRVVDSMVVTACVPSCVDPSHKFPFCSRRMSESQIANQMQRIHHVWSTRMSNLERIFWISDSYGTNNRRQSNAYCHNSTNDSPHDIQAQQSGFAPLL